LLEMVNWHQFQLRNPLTLSGGEQVIVSLATAILATRDLVAVDCCFEQLSADTRRRAIELLTEIGHAGVTTVLADNRLREFATHVTVEPVERYASAGDFGAAPIIRGTSFAYSVASHCICLNNISFGYGQSRFIFQDLCYRFEPGRLYFLKGPNGAGKTTLCKLLCGLLRPDRGHITDGRGVSLDTWKKPGRIAAYHFQNPDLQLFSTRVEHEIGLGRLDVAMSFGLETFMASHPHDLPFVLRKRVALAATFARRCPWLILDEPALGQDDANATSLAEILGTLIDANVGIIVVTHSEWFRQLVTGARVLHLEGGRLRQEGGNGGE
jgi:energy-coupling factor transport system ATP-binding protein